MATREPWKPAKAAGWGIVAAWLEHGLENRDEGIEQDSRYEEKLFIE